MSNILNTISQMFGFLVILLAIPTIATAQVGEMQQNDPLFHGFDIESGQFSLIYATNAAKTVHFDQRIRLDDDLFVIDRTKTVNNRQLDHRIRLSDDLWWSTSQNRWSLELSEPKPSDDFRLEWQNNRYE